MDVKVAVNGLKPKMEAAITHFSGELKTVRTGRANVQILDGITVSYYGSQTPLRGMANITVPEPTQLLVQPFDANALGDIRQAIELAQLGLSLSDDGRNLRINIPPLTTERREELIKRVGKMAEEARISIRGIRGDMWDQVQKAEKDSLISEDNRDWARAELDKLAGEYNKKIEELTKEKEAELRTV